MVRRRVNTPGLWISYIAKSGLAMAQLIARTNGRTYERANHLLNIGFCYVTRTRKVGISSLDCEAVMPNV